MLRRENFQKCATLRAMLDIKLLRDDPEAFKTRVRSRGGDSHQLIDQLVECDEVRRRGETEKQALQGERNSRSKEIGAKKKAGEVDEPVDAETMAR